MNKISKNDYRFVPVDPDLGFDPKHNEKVISDSIKKTERIRRLKQAEYKDLLRERTEAISTYVKNIDNGNTSSDVVDYFGKKELARLRGEEIRQSILGRLSDYKRKEVLERSKSSQVGKVT